MDVGLNRTVTLCLAPAAMENDAPLPEHEPETTTQKPDAVVDALPVSVPLPGFRTVNVRFAVVPTETLPKLSELGVTLISGLAAVPVPVIAGDTLPPLELKPTLPE
jgi:hypothetical protein